MNLLVWDKEKKRAKINAKAAFYFYDTFGVPKEVFAEYVNEKAPPGSLVRQKMVSMAYDEAHGTNTLAMLEKMVKETGVY